MKLISNTPLSLSAIPLLRVFCLNIHDDYRELLTVVLKALRLKALCNTAVITVTSQAAMLHQCLLSGLPAAPVSLEIFSEAKLRYLLVHR